MVAEPEGTERVHTAELIASLCLATDLGMAFPFEHGLHTTLIAMRLAGKLGIDRASACETYYARQLSHAGDHRDQLGPAWAHPTSRAPAGPGAVQHGERGAHRGVARGAGFAELRTEEVPVRFQVPDVDEYLSAIADTAGPIGLALRGLGEAERAQVKAEVEDSLRRFASEGGHELPGVALCAVAS